MTTFYTLHGKWFETRAEVDADAQALLEQGYWNIFNDIETWDTEEVYGPENDDKFQSDMRLAEERNRLIDFRGF